MPGNQFCDVVQHYPERRLLFCPTFLSQGLMREESELDSSNASPTSRTSGRAPSRKHFSPLTITPTQTQTLIQTLQVF